MRKLLTNRRDTGKKFPLFEGLKCFGYFDWREKIRSRPWRATERLSSRWLTTYFQIKHGIVLLMSGNGLRDSGTSPYLSARCLIRLTPSGAGSSTVTARCCVVVRQNCFKLAGFSQHLHVNWVFFRLINAFASLPPASRWGIEARRACTL